MTRIQRVIHPKLILPHSQQMLTKHHTVFRLVKRKGPSLLLRSKYPALRETAKKSVCEWRLCWVLQRNGQVALRERKHLSGRDMWALVPTAEETSATERGQTLCEWLKNNQSQTSVRPKRHCSLWQKRCVMSPSMPQVEEGLGQHVCPC